MQHVRVRILGDLEVEGCEPAQLGRRQVRTLLKVLALGQGRPVSVDRIVDCLWGDLRRRDRQNRFRCWPADFAACSVPTVSSGTTAGTG